MHEFSLKMFIGKLKKQISCVMIRISWDDKSLKKSMLQSGENFFKLLLCAINLFSIFILIRLSNELRCSDEIS